MSKNPFLNALAATAYITLIASAMYYAPKANIPDNSVMIPIVMLSLLVLSAALFMLGVIGVMTRRNIIIIFMSIELMLNAVNINLVAFSRQLASVSGQAFAIFVIADAAAEAAIGLGILIAFFRNRSKLGSTS